LPIHLEVDAIRRCLETGLGERLGRPVVIEEIASRGLDYSRVSGRASRHSYACDALTVGLSGGETIHVFLKDFAAFTTVKDGMEGMRRRREREFRTYRDLLANSGLGPPEYYGSIWDEDRGMYLLLLEFVDGIEVRCREFESWVIAARWLGAFQGFFGARRNACAMYPLLLQHTDGFFRERAELALSVLSQISTDLYAAIVPIVARYGPIVDLMVSQPQIFVHGAYAPSTILVVPERDPVRVCPFDWELAGLGSPLFDLAFLCDGFDQTRLDVLVGAYWEEAASHRVPLPSRADAAHLINCFRLHRRLNWISRSLEREYSLATVTKLVRTTEEVGRLVV
jgi:hypothetical protein